MSESDTPSYEEQWQELDEKTIMVQCLIELQQIRMTLQDTQGETRTGSSDTYECDRCGARINARYDYCQDCFQAIRRSQARR